MRLRLIPNAGKEFHRLWSLQVGVFMLGVKGVLAVIMVFAGELNPWLILGISVVGTILVGIARFTKQEGPADGDV